MLSQPKICNINAAFCSNLVRSNKPKNENMRENEAIRINDSFIHYILSISFSQFFNLKMIMLTYKCIYT